MHRSIRYINDADAIIIGSGHNGLACAMMLADAGWRVLVVEKAKKPGGASKTGEITLPGFHHDLYAPNILHVILLKVGF